MLKLLLGLYITLLNINLRLFYTRKNGEGLFFIISFILRCCLLSWQQITPHFPFLSEVLITNLPNHATQQTLKSRECKKQKLTIHFVYMPERMLEVELCVPNAIV